VTADAIRNVVKMDRRSESARAVVLGTAPALLARVGRLTDLVTSLSVQEAMVAALAANSRRADEADGGVSLELEALH